MPPSAVVKFLVAQKLKHPKSPSVPGFRPRYSDSIAWGTVFDRLRAVSFADLLLSIHLARPTRKVDRKDRTVRFVIVFRT
jgi:hypothetical protein